MNWLVWKQHRKLFLILGILLVLYAGVAIPMGSHLWHTYQYANTACKKDNDCDQLSNELFQTGWSRTLNPNDGGINSLDAFAMLVPFLLGMFIGVPLISREYSSKTNLLIWTRSVSRRRWLTTKLAWILLATAVFAGCFAALTTYWSRAGNALYVDRFSTVLFSTQNIVPAGYALLAVSIGIALGAWFKRTMLAIGLTLILLIAAQITIFNFVRPNYMTPLAADIWTNQLGPGPASGPASMVIPNDAEIISSEIVNKQEQVLNWTSPPSQCIVPQNELPGLMGGGPGPQHASISIHSKNIGSIMSVNGGPAVKGSCLETVGYHYAIKYQPGYRYWDFQRIELGLYLALSVIPIGATYWLVLKRDA